MNPWELVGMGFCFVGFVVVGVLAIREKSWLHILGCGATAILILLGFLDELGLL